jgi:hypothetical protein
MYDERKTTQNRIYIDHSQFTPSSEKACNIQINQYIRVPPYFLFPDFIGVRMRDCCAKVIATLICETEKYMRIFFYLIGYEVNM